MTRRELPAFAFSLSERKLFVPKLTRSFQETLPAGFWRAFLCAVGLWLAAGHATAQPQPDGDEARQSRGGEILSELREVGLEGDYFLSFDLRILPRRGRARVYHGQLWGSRNAEGPVSRVVLYGSEGGEPLRTLLVQNGPRPRAWVWEPSMATAQLLPESDWQAPLLAGAEISAFDLLMPYLYWEDFDFEGADKVLGRAADRFLLRTPKGEGAASEPLAVRAYFDEQFHALLQSKLLDAAGAPLKTMTVRDLKKISGQWMLKSIELRNERTRDKTRFEVREAALGLDLSPQVFEPASLREVI
ncbi:hypothetical protein AXK11_03905, partial [Cephaloticoccus primus]